VLLALLLSLCVVPSASASHPIQTGVYLSGAGPSPLVYEQAQAAGATIDRIAVRWDSVAPSAPPPGFNPRDPDDPAYNWSAVDAEVQLAAAHGLEPLLTLYEAPRWAETGPGDLSGGASRVDPTAYGDFAAAAAARYDGSHDGLPRVRYWQAWNEPNVNVYLAPQFAYGAPTSPTLYRAMVNAFADAVHAAQPGNLVVAGGLSPFTVVRGATMTIGPLRFMRELLCMSSGPHPKPTCRVRVDFDIWGHNPYTSGDATHKAANPDDVSLGDLPRMRSLLDAAYAAGHIASRGRPGFWVTEFSWDSNPPDPHAVPLALHARWTAEALYQAWRSGASVLIWLQWRDAPYPSSSFQSGLYFIDGRPKPALAAFRLPFVAYTRPHGVYVWARTPSGRPGTVVIERRVGAAWKPVATVRADRYGIAQRTLTGTYTQQDFLLARVAGAVSVPFSLRQPPDRQVDPFGGGG
jgi:hypothetical protein